MRDLTFGNDISINSTLLVNASGTFDISTGSVSEHVASLSGTGNVTLGIYTLTIGGTDITSTFSGVISGTGGLIRSGSGTQIFSRSNTYTGVTTVTAGTLLVNGTQTGNVTVSGGIFGGSGSVGALAAMAGGTISPGVNGAGTLSCGNFSLPAGSILNVGLTSVTTGGFGTLNVTGTVTLGGTLQLSPVPNAVLPAGSQLLIIANDGADAVTGTFAGLAQGAQITSSGLMGNISYVGGTGNDVLLSLVNSVPVAGSGLTVTPSPGHTGQLLTFTFAVTDANDDTLIYAWDFGDGTTSSTASLTHAYSVAGTYNATVTVSDGQGGTVSGSGSIVIAAPLVGEGADSDGDGFSDDFENAAMFDPLNAASTPTGAVLNLQTLATPKIAIALNFAKPNLDSITLNGTVAVPAKFVATGQRVVVDIGGVTMGFTLTSKGAGTVGKNTFKIGLKAGLQKFTVKFVKGSFKAALADEGLVSITDKGSLHQIACSLLFNANIYQTHKTVTYKARVGKTGTAR